MSKDQMFVEVVAASTPVLWTDAPAIYTIHARYPRIIHAEIMTHRVFSRNARSSRAVPVATMLKEIREKPFIPWHWGKNQKGMQASEECNEPVNWHGNEKSREEAWRNAAFNAAQAAEVFADAGYHKQIANRTIEPYSFIDTLITSTDWANFMHLRDHKDAEPHFQDLAKMMRNAMEIAPVRALRPGEWHLPYVDREERDGLPLDVQQKLSVARCARISYAPFDGDASIEKELERYELLVGSSPLHASPAEHQATPDVYVPGYDMFANEHQAGNLGPGWIQYRKTLPGEYVRDAA